MENATPHDSQAIKSLVEKETRVMSRFPLFSRKLSRHIFLKTCFSGDCDLSKCDCIFSSKKEQNVIWCVCVCACVSMCKCGPFPKPMKFQIS